MDRICKFWYFEKKMKVKIREYFIFPFVCKAFKNRSKETREFRIDSGPWSLSSLPAYQE